VLDIRATAYISPLSEVEFTDVTLTVHIVNVADETGQITGLFRVYNDTTHELLHSSEIAPLTLSAGQSADVSALTDFSPPAPLDDTYFVIFTGNASNPLVPRGINFFLGSFHFDVKPGPLGPPPAAHHTTHEQAGADPIDVEDLGTDELDDTLVLSPDGAGGVQWAAAPTGTTDQYREHSDFESPLTNYGCPPWYEVALSSGGILPMGGGINHPGVHRLSSSTSANSGAAIKTDNDCFLLGGAESCEIIFKLGTLAGTVAYLGFTDEFTGNDAVDGAYFAIDQVGGVDGTLVGKCSSNSARSTTSTDYALTTDTWYRAIVTVNSDATRVDFYLYAEDGSLLWTNYLTTNIPTADGRETGNAVVVFNTGTSATPLFYIDSLSMSIARDLVR